jgi:hypothetical protein
MIGTHIRYTVQAEYAAHNKANIGRVMEELRALGRTDIRYSVFVEDDGKTFNHWPLFATDEAASVISQLPAFKTFLSELQASHLEAPPKTTNLTLVDSSSDFF